MLHVLLRPAALASVLLLSCSRHNGTDTDFGPGLATTATTSTNPPVAPDRLAPGELAKSSKLAFGFPIPATMSVERAFPNAIHLSGEANVTGLMHYVQQNAQAGRVELLSNAIVFETVRIPAAGPNRTFRLEISAQGRNARLLIKETTLAESPKEDGLTDAERWRRAGMKPNGEPLDISQLQ